jgi:hypothetical protein
MLYITDLSGNRLAYRGLTVIDNNETLKIKTKMLDGSWSIQQIGSAAKTLTVSVIVQDTSELDDICESCESIKIYHTRKIYTGIISSESISWVKLAPGIDKRRGTFELTVSEEETR